MNAINITPLDAARMARSQISDAIAALDVACPDPEHKAVLAELYEIEERLLAVGKRIAKLKGNQNEV